MPGSFVGRLRHGRRRLQASVRTGAQIRLARAGYLVTKVDQDAIRYLVPSHDESLPLPAGTTDRLRSDHPRLELLRREYAALGHAASVPSQWSEEFLAENLSLERFRGDNAYVWQQRLFRDSFKARTYLSLLDIESRDRLGLLRRLDEDGLFGALTFAFGDRGLVSRDLLDSVNEINYLDDRIGLSTMAAPRVLDIGAGYGRLAHRMARALPSLAAYDCTDGVAMSTYLCEVYAEFRGLPDTVRVVPLHEVHRLAESYDVAVNVHSFSECSHAAVRWWLDRIAERRVEWLLVVPNTPGELLSTESDGRREDFLPDVEAAGYTLVDHRPVYGSDEMRDMIGIEDEFFLFRRATPAS